DQYLAGQAVDAVDQHGVGPADPVGAGAAEGERAVHLPLDQVEHVQQPVFGLGVDDVLLVTGTLVLPRIVTPDANTNLHVDPFLSWRPSRLPRSVLALLRLEAG